MEVIEVLHMNGGIGDASYANNSLVQKKVIAMTKPITEKAIIDLYCSTLPKRLCIADLGCSSGPNTLFVASELIKTVDKICKELGHQSPEFVVNLNDLPGNDFNTIFKSFLPSFQQQIRTKLGSSFGPCFVSAVPGSFYGRLFPTESLHFVHSSYSLQWLSQVPEGIEGNKGNIYMASSSPPGVLKAYYEQFQRDFSVFLKCRSEEMVRGGRMALTILGRKSEDPSSKECCYIWELLAMALREMVSEGLIEQEKMDSFNIPQYTPSPSEVKIAVEKEGSFAIDRLEASEVDWNACENGLSLSNGFKDGGSYNVAQCMRAVAEPLLVSHFSEAMMDEVFRRYREIIVDRMSKEKTQFINVVIAMTKTG
ncbi:S-adenosyl-L-methionine:benzoic acid/salicylic acid carboxyl methyltransferase 3-like [Cornus florida]|uniref:S-adenosyl-L-methionine:benzoic acid/salicylic acid carboxyl methyltransferase 3-like n=1 Tax=Cornus florida TaxID=4283 RepID=UPI00289E7DAF|nr:S-adenosyl-L-methionine:benzoic acid/salicylic acid carboxyl methyltransferase 3-like [Cornus florida]